MTELQTLFLAVQEFLLAAAVLAGAMVAGALLQRWLIRARARRHVLAWASAPSTPSSSWSDGAHVCLRGTLRADGALPETADGVPAAAITTQRRDGDPLAVSRRAPALALEVGGEWVELLGPVEVALGTRELSAPRPLELSVTRHATHVRAIGADEQVAIPGVLRRVGGETPGYRTSAARWVLEPRTHASDAGGDVREPYIRLYAADAARAATLAGPPLRRMLAGGLGGAMTAAIALVAVSAVTGLSADVRDADTVAAWPALDPGCERYLAPAPDLPQADSQGGGFYYPPADELGVPREVHRCPAIDGDRMSAEHAHTSTWIGGDDELD